MHAQGGEEPDEQANKPVWMQDENGDAEAQSPTAVQFAPPQPVPTSPSANGHAEDDLLGDDAAANGDVPPAPMPQPVDPLADLYGLQTGPGPVHAAPAGTSLLHVLLSF